MTDHPITPPPELVQQWRDVPEYATGLEKLTMVTLTTAKLQEIATQAARWGADQELLACGNYLKQCAAWEEEDVTEFYNYRRPRPLSLKELALESVKRFEKSGEFFSDQMRELEFIRKALETIDD
jgi:hypothetical protein